MKRLLALLLLLATGSLAHAIDPAGLEDPVQQARYLDLIHELRCLKCQGETVADTPADFAKDIRIKVREMILAGRSDGEIRTYLVDRYGEIILLKPRFSIANAWLWLAPGVLLVAGGFIALRVIRQRRDLLANDASEPGDEELRS
jgi:cytochrome c-type biogenesis protein CcmH